MNTGNDEGDDKSNTAVMRRDKKCEYEERCSVFRGG
jgi:hypothetical protein